MKLTCSDKILLTKQHFSILHLFMYNYKNGQSHPEQIYILTSSWKKNFIYNIAFEKMDQEFFLDLCPMGNTQQDAPTTMLRFTGNGVPRAQVAPEYNLEVSEQQAWILMQWLFLKRKLLWLFAIMSWSELLITIFGLIMHLSLSKILTSICILVLKLLQISK